MQDTTLILLAAGNSTRFGLPTKKQWLYIKDRPLWLFVAEQFEQFNFVDIIVVANEIELKLMQDFADYKFVPGGKNSRAESVLNALNEVKTDFVLVTDVARCCIDKNVIFRLFDKKQKDSCVVPTLKVTDTSYYDGKPIDREKLLRVQTPQLSCTKSLKEILLNRQNYTDESSAFYDNGKKVTFVEGSSRATKLTYKEDLDNLKCLKPPDNIFRVGEGIDIHAFEEGKAMVLCGVDIDSPIGFKAHSDGDVAIHAIIDALLGASNLGDIGEFFPDTDKKYKNADSKKLLKEVIDLVRNVGYEIVNIDISIVAQKPKISPYKQKMKQRLGEIMQLKQNNINIKATTGEKLGFVGRAEGVVVQAVATLKYYNWERV